MNFPLKMKCLCFKNDSFVMYRIFYSFCGMCVGFRPLDQQPQAKLQIWTWMFYKWYTPYTGH